MTGKCGPCKPNHTRLGHAVRIGSAYPFGRREPRSSKKLALRRHGGAEDELKKSTGRNRCGCLTQISGQPARNLLQAFFPALPPWPLIAFSSTSISFTAVVECVTSTLGTNNRHCDEEEQSSKGIVWGVTPSALVGLPPRCFASSTPRPTLTPSPHAHPRFLTSTRSNFFFVICDTSPPPSETVACLTLSHFSLHHPQSFVILTSRVHRDAHSDLTLHLVLRRLSLAPSLLAAAGPTD